MLLVGVAECSGLPVGRRLRPSTHHPDLARLNAMMKYVAHVAMPLLVMAQDVRPKTQVVVDRLGICGAL